MYSETRRQSVRACLAVQRSCTGQAWCPDRRAMALFGGSFSLNRTLSSAHLKEEETSSEELIAWYRYAIGTFWMASESSRARDGLFETSSISSKQFPQIRISNLALEMPPLARALTQTIALLACCESSHSARRGSEPWRLLTQGAPRKLQSDAEARSQPLQM